MVYDIIMWFYASMALMVAALLWLFASREKPPPPFPPEWICDGCGQVCSKLKEGFCEYCAKQY